MIYLQSTTPHYEIVSSELVSYIVPIYACAPGKAMLAFSSSELISRVLNSRLEQFTRHTLATKEALAAELAEIRRLGYAINRGEHVDSGLQAIAAPIFDHTGLPAASVCFYGFNDPEAMQAMTGALANLARTLSASLGFSPSIMELVG